MKNLLCSVYFQKIHTGITVKARLSSLHLQKKCEFHSGEQKIIKIAVLVQPRGSLFTLLFPNVVAGWSVREQRDLREIMTVIGVTSPLFCLFFFTSMWTYCKQELPLRAWLSWWAVEVHALHHHPHNLWQLGEMGPWWKTPGKKHSAESSLVSFSVILTSATGLMFMFVLYVSKRIPYQRRWKKQGEELVPCELSPE